MQNLLLKLLNIIIVLWFFSNSFLYAKENYKQNYEGKDYSLKIIIGSVKNNQLTGMLSFNLTKNKFLKLKDVKDINLTLVDDFTKIVLNTTLFSPDVKKITMENGSILYVSKNDPKIPFTVDMNNDNSEFSLIGQLQFYICDVQNCNLEKIKLNKIFIKSNLNKILIDERINSEIKKLPLNISANIFKAVSELNLSEKKIKLTLNNPKIKNIDYAIFSSNNIEFMDDVKITKNNNNTFTIEGLIKNFGENDKKAIDIKINVNTNLGNFILNDTILINDAKIKNINNEIKEMYSNEIKESKFKHFVLLIILCFSPIMLVIFYNRIKLLNKMNTDSIYVNELLYFMGLIFAITTTQILILNYFNNFIFFMYYLLNEFYYMFVIINILVLIHTVFLEKINTFLMKTTYIKYLLAFCYGAISFFIIFLVIILLLQNTFHYVTVDYNLELLQIVTILTIVILPYLIYYFFKKYIKEIIESNQLKLFKNFVFMFAYIIVLFIIFMLMIGHIYYFAVILFLIFISCCFLLIKYKIKDIGYQQIIVLLIFLGLLIISFFEKPYEYGKENFRISETGIIWNKIEKMNDLSDKIKNNDGVLIVKITSDWCLKCYLADQVFKNKKLNTVIRGEGAFLFEYNISKNFDLGIMQELKKYNKLGLLPFVLVIKKDKAVISYDNYFKNNLINFLK